MQTITTGVILFFVVFNVIEDADGITCLSCTEVIQPRYCFNIRNCPQHQFCGVKKYMTTTGRYIFDVDCASHEVCQRDSSTSNNLTGTVNTHQHDHVTCDECCTSDLCNQQGCGEIGYPTERGPVCYNCKQESDPATCEKILTCHQDEDCLASLPAIFGRKRRSTGVAAPCTACCESDLCNDNCGKDSTEREFLFMFLSKYYDYDQRLLREDKVMAIANSGFVNTILPGNNLNRSVTIPRFGLYYFNVSKSEFTIQNIVERKAVYLQSSEPITVFAMQRERSLDDGFLVLPISTYSNRYIVPVYQPDPDPKASGFIGIVSVSDGNNINITIRTTSGQTAVGGTNYGNNDTIKLILGKHETFELAHKHDLTGTEITSTKPICVTSGCDCAKVMDSDRYCSGLEEMIIPVKHFTDRFIVIYGRVGSVVRILASSDNTSLTWNTGSSKTNSLLGTGSYKDIESDNEVTYIESSSPVIVTQYVKRKGTNDSFMMVLPGISQYKSNYDFAVPNGGYVSYITLIIPSVDVNGLYLDGKNISILSGSRNSLVVKGIQYDVFALAVSPGAHNMKQLNKHGFGLFVYGTHVNESNGYGYPAGFRLKN